MLTEQQKTNALQADMFAGDRADGTERCLENKIVVGRVSTPCSWCGLPTKPKTHHRTLKMIFDGELMSYRYCESCCKAMAASERIGEPDILEMRMDLAKRRQERRAVAAGEEYPQPYA